MKSVSDAARESTCQKRATVCVIYDRNGSVLSCESNRCAPESGACERLGVVQKKVGYAEKSCNWTHAEIKALEALPEDAHPYRAEVYGHDFACDSCEKALRARGVEIIKIVFSGEGTGLRQP